jgi:ABC-type phosphate transport system substrate-binding protein
MTAPGNEGVAQRVKISTNSIGYIPLPASIVAKAKAALDSIH